MEELRFDARKHAYFLRENGKERPLQGVTSVLGVIAKPALIGWAAKMACEYIGDNSHPCPQSEDWIHISAYTLREAATAYAKTRDTAAEAGTDLHALVEDYVGACIANTAGAPFADGTIEQQYAAIHPFINWAIKENIRFIAAEQRLYSKELSIAGTCDLIFEKDGKRYIGDIKTYKKLWSRTPMLQCAAYGLMWEEMQHLAQLEEIADGGKAINDYTRQSIDGYCILRLSKDGSFEEKWSYDVEGDREGFMSALKLYRCLQHWTA